MLINLIDFAYPNISQDRRVRHLLECRPPITYHHILVEIMNSTTTQAKPGHRPELVLASTSPFRKALLDKLLIPFSCFAPNIDESAIAGERAEDLVVRLARLKAAAGADLHPDALIIGSDQVACIDGRILGKPGNRERAIQQLEQASGKQVSFHTGLCLLDARHGLHQAECVPFHVYFRPLTRTMIEAYVDKELPFNCAGSFKSEGLGIALFESLQGDDPNTLIGLPLIRLIHMLENAGYPILDAQRTP